MWSAWNGAWNLSSVFDMNKQKNEDLSRVQFEFNHLFVAFDGHKEFEGWYDKNDENDIIS